MGQRMLRGLFEFSMVEKSTLACAAKAAITNLPRVTSSCKNEVLGPWESCCLQSAPKAYRRCCTQLAGSGSFGYPWSWTIHHCFLFHWEVDVLDRKVYESWQTVIFSCKSFDAALPGGWSKPSWHHVRSLHWFNTPPQSTASHTRHSQTDFCWFEGRWRMPSLPLVLLSLLEQRVLFLLSPSGEQ